MLLYRGFHYFYNLYHIAIKGDYVFSRRNINRNVA